MNCTHVLLQVLLAEIFLATSVTLYRRMLLMKDHVPLQRKAMRENSCALSTLSFLLHVNSFVNVPACFGFETRNTVYIATCEHAMFVLYMLFDGSPCRLNPYSSFAHLASKHCFHTQTYTRMSDLNTFALDSWLQRIRYLCSPRRAKHSIRPHLRTRRTLNWTMSTREHKTGFLGSD